MDRPTLENNDPLEQQRRAQREAAIADFGQRFLAGPNRDVYEDMLLTICRLARDGATRGDVKILSKSLAEMRYALKVFGPYRETRKISIFGSARTPEDHPNYLAAVEFAAKVSAAGWMVITGAGDGIMKAGHGGAGREASFGVAIRLPFEQKTNTIIADDRKLVNFRYFFARKLMFMREASAIALFPGGFGTQDEGFEALTLVQTGKAPLIPIVMIEQRGGTYWRHWLDWVRAELLGAGLVGRDDLSLFHLTDSIDDALNYVRRFYRIYHSMRWVNDDLVLRLERPLSARTLDRLNAEYAPLLSAAAIEQGQALPQEEGEYSAKPRLIFHFDRRSYGVLRRMIDVINSDVDA